MLELQPILDLQKIKARCEKAEKGPWVYEYLKGCMIPEHVIHIYSGGTYTICTPVHTNPNTQANMDFIAHAREDVPALVAKVEGLRHEVKSLLTSGYAEGPTCSLCGHFSHGTTPCAWHAGTCDEANADRALLCCCDGTQPSRYIHSHSEGKDAVQ